MTTNKDALEEIATEYVYLHHGRGLSTSMGIRTREHIKNAFIAGHKNALQTQAELVDKAKALYDALEKTNWSSWQTTASFSKQQEELGEALARAEERE